jgi:RNA polymerase sigma factor (sigma-70 family)
MVSDLRAGDGPGATPACDVSLLSNDELVRRARDHGDRGAEDALLSRHSTLITRVARAIFHRQRLASADWPDALQESLWAIREAISGFPRSPPRTMADDRFPRFLVTVVAACVKDHARRVRAHQRHAGQRIPLALLADWARRGHRSRGDLSVEPVGNEPDPSHAAEQNEIVGRVRNALGRLPARGRELLKLVQAGLSLRKVARRWHRPYGRVKRLWQASKKHLRAELGKLLA